MANSVVTGSPAAVAASPAAVQQQVQKPAEVKVNAFVQENHDRVMSFLINFNVDAYKDVAKTHVEAKIWKTANLVIAAFAAGISAFAGYKGHKYVAIGAGIVTVVSLAFGREKTLNATKEFTAFTAASDAAVAHLTSAFVAKSQFMIDQVSVAANGWKVGHDQSLSKAYNSGKNDKYIVVEKITDEQNQWRGVHQTLVDAVKPRDFAPVKDGNSHLNAVLEKLAKARDLILFGRSPAATEPKEQTYVNYNKEGTASVWA